MASATSLSGYILSMTDTTFPASTSSRRTARSSLFWWARKKTIRWLTAGDSKAIRTERLNGPIQRVNRCCPDVDQYLLVADGRHVDVPEFQDVRRAIPVVADYLHMFPHHSEVYRTCLIDAVRDPQPCQGFPWSALTPDHHIPKQA